MIEKIGFAVAVLGGWLVVLGLLAGALRLSWFVYTEIIGWPRVWKALRLLKEKESPEGEKP
jgi:hypothetical protein